ncbi:hypothetical protein B0T20DRAFT_333679, partial [Sordaria brevicollis]
YVVQCEVAAMAFLRDNVKTFQFPKCYAVERPGSERARRVGAGYMLIKGFFGNTVEQACKGGGEVWELPVKTQEHIMAQWTLAQAELASFTFPTIGSISEYSPKKGPTIGPIAAGAINGFADSGPLSSSWEYFRILADARFRSALQRSMSSSTSPSSPSSSSPESPSNLITLGHYIFRDLVHNSPHFRSLPSANGPFPFNHMDLGIQNILV